MQYTELKVDYRKPYIWHRPQGEKIPKIGKSYLKHAEEILEFNKLKESAKKEICNVVTKNIDLSQTKNELNQRLDEIFDHYGKGLIACEDIDEGFLLRKTNKNTLNKKLQGWCKNLQFNIPTIIKSSPYANLTGKFKDVPAFVCLAGPSLKNNREKLKQLGNKGLVIAVDTSLRPLLDVGIVPQFCVTHDANPNGCKFFLSGEHPYNKFNVQLNDMNDEQLALVYAEFLNDKERLNFKYNTVGLFVNYVHPLTLLAWNGSAKAFYSVFDPSLPVYDIMASSCNYNNHSEKLTKEEKGRVIGGSSVGHVATYIAVALGCNPISFLGLDLSYPGGKTYIEGASNQKSVENQRLIEVEDLSGNKVSTNLSMLSYKIVFENSLPNIAIQTQTNFYNCTEDDKGNPAGILEIGAEPKSLNWVLNEYNKEFNLDVKRTLEGN